MKQLILGTAQLNDQYGINNDNHGNTLKQSYSILETAFENKINILDTAPDYGDSEKIIGKYIHESNNRFQIATKLSSVPKFETLNNYIDDKIECSLKNLDISYLDYYLIQHYPLLYMMVLLFYMYYH